MKTRNIQILTFGLILVCFLIGAYLHSYMPEKMASHWDANDMVDGYTSQFWGLFLMPVISTILFLVFMLVPKIDPLRRTSRSSEGTLMCSCCCSSDSCSTFTC